MKLSILLHTVLLFSITVCAWAEEIVIVQSLRIKPYQDAAQGFLEESAASAITLYSSEYTRGDLVKELRDKRPSVIIAIGNDALSKVSRIRDIPIVYLMVLYPERYANENSNIRGISMTIPPEHQLGMIQKVLPSARKIGVIYNEHGNGSFIRKAITAARARGMELITREATNSREVPGILNGLRDQVQVLWILPDTTVLTKTTLDSILYFSMENKIPVIAFSSKYVEMGAFMSIDIDPYRAGQQAGAMANHLLMGDTCDFEPDAIGCLVTINSKVARKLNLNVGGEIANVRYVR